MESLPAPLVYALVAMVVAGCLTLVLSTVYLFRPSPFDRLARRIRRSAMRLIPDGRRDRPPEVIIGVDEYTFSRPVGPWLGLGLRDAARERGLPPGSVIEVKHGPRPRQP